MNRFGKISSPEWKKLSSLAALERSNHIDAITEGLKHNRTALAEIGLFATSTDAEIEDFVSATVHNAFSLRRLETVHPDDYDQEYIDEVEAFGQAISGKETNLKALQHQVANDYLRLLVYAGVVQPVLADDWVVDRRLDTALSLGLLNDTEGEDPLDGARAVNEMEARVRDRLDDNKPSIFVSMVKGSGNGRFVQDKRLARAEEEYERKYTEIGYGDRLYVSIDDVLSKFLKPDTDYDIESNLVGYKYFVSVLNSLFRRYLHNERTLEGREWNKGTDFFDFNKLYELLREPEKLRSFVGFTENPYEASLSMRFVQDRYQDLQLALYIGLARFVKDLGVYDTENWFSRMRGCIKEVRDFCAIRVEDLVTLQDAPISQVDFLLLYNYLGQLKWLRPKMDFSDYEFDAHDPEKKRNLLQFLIQSFQELESSFTEASNRIQHLTADEIIDLLQLDFDSNEILRIFFEDEFLDSINSDTPIDLNDIAANTGDEKPCYAEGYIRGLFEDMAEVMVDPRTMEPIRVHSMLDVRAGSHGNAEALKRDLAANLCVLESGGVIASDAIVESFTMMIRLDVVDALVDDSGGHRARVVLKGNEPQAVIIQKAGAERFLPETFFKKSFDGRHVVEVPVARRIPFVAVSNEVRRVLVEQGEHTYRGIQHSIDQFIRDNYLDVILEGEVNDYWIENIEKTPQLNLLFSLYSFMLYVYSNINFKERMILARIFNKFYGRFFGTFSPEFYHKHITQGLSLTGKSKDVFELYKEAPFIAIYALGVQLFNYICREEGSDEIKFTGFEEKLYQGCLAIMEEFGSSDNFSLILEKLRQFLLENLDEDSVVEFLTRDFDSDKVDSDDSDSDKIDPDSVRLLIPKFKMLFEEYISTRSNERLSSDINRIFYAIANRFEIASIDLSFIDEYFLQSIIDGVGDKLLHDTVEREGDVSYGMTPMQISEVVSRVFRDLKRYCGVEVEGYQSGIEVNFDTQLASLPREGDQTPYNTCHVIDKSELPDNHGVKEVRDSEKFKMQADLLEVRERTGLEKPIFFLNFTDCVTNRSFLDRFEEWGLMDYVNVLDFDLREGTIDKARSVLRKLQPYIGELEFVDGDIKKVSGIKGGAGGIVIVGGNWDNTPSEGGKLIKKFVTYPIMDSMTKFSPESRALRALYVCFGAQEHHDALVSRHKADEDGDYSKVGVQQGMFEFGMFPFEKTGNEYDDIIFNGAGDQVSVVATHGGQIPEIDDTGVCVPVGKNLVTGMAMGHVSLDGRVLAYPVHPEVAPKDIQRVLFEAGAFKSQIAAAIGGLPFACIESGFDVEVQGDAGARILYNSLNHHLRGIISQLDELEAA